MARFLVWSDLHDEFWNALPDIPDSAMDVDALLLAGDISTRGRHVDAALLLYDRLRKPVIMIRGNHEFYGSTMPGIMSEDRRRIAEINAAGGDIRLLEGDVTEVAGTRIIGATLWTDLDLYPGHAAETRKAVRRGMNDFPAITMATGRSFDIETWLELHWKDREAILSHLGEPFDGPTLVMTHHMPVREMVHPMREVGNPERFLINAAFASDMAWQIRDHEIDAWICGHSHDNRRAELCGATSPIRFIANARGYPREGAEFDPGLIVETGLPAPDPVFP